MSGYREKRGEIASASDHGFRMPAEWEAHSRTWMAWPCRNEVWGGRLEDTKRDYAAVANAIAGFEPVTMVVPPAAVPEARRHLDPSVDILPLEIDDSWARDSGPNFLIDGAGALAGACWTFNAWGEKYSPYEHDAALGRHLVEHAQAKLLTSPLVAEGGAISVDGEGTVLTTETCLLNSNRNPGWSKQEVERELCRVLGAQKVIWLPGNPKEEETNGHVDGIAVFVRPGVVLAERSRDPGSPFYREQRANIDALQGQTDAKGRALETVFIEDAWGAEELNDKFCLSYINFYLPNGAVIMPKYGVPADDRARAVLAELYPKREIVQLRIDNIAIGGGGIHCITQQQPAQ